MWAWGRLLVVGCVLAGLTLPAIASGAVYNGTQFPRISESSDPEEFAWEVQLLPEQELVQIDDHEAAVFYTGAEHTRAFTIEVEPAHDALGTSVPTTLAIVAPNTITFTVHHRAGNPAAEGAPFVYPIVAGPGYTIGYSTVTVTYGQPTEPSAWPKELHIRCSEGGEAAKVKPAHCRVSGHDGTAFWIADLARLRWRHWGDPVARGIGVAVNPEQHIKKRVRVLALEPMECDGTAYYDRLRLISPRLQVTIRNISPC